MSCNFFALTKMGLAPVLAANYFWIELACSAQSKKWENRNNNCPQHETGKDLPHQTLAERGFRH
jgi:hypothetical protein